VILLVKRWNDLSRRGWAYAALIWCFAYLLISLFNKDHVDKQVRKIAHSRNIRNDHFLSTPTPLNNLLWFVAIPDSNGFFIGYRSVFDSKPDMEFRYVNRNDSLLASLPDQESIRQLKRFSQGYYTAEVYSRDTVVFNDLRFGQEAGWINLRNPFAFHFYLNHPDENALVVQRGRFARWDMRVMWRRMWGSQ
jgi:inner membrane protein